MVCPRLSPTLALSFVRVRQWFCLFIFCFTEWRCADGGAATGEKSAFGGAPDLSTYERKHAARKAPVVRADEKPVMGLVSQKNYVTANAVDNILAVPKRTGGGDVNYLKKKDYGQVPAYLGRVKEEVAEEYRLINEMQAASMEDDEKLEVLGESERQELLRGLKQNWERINKEYQQLSFALDTPAKKARKEQYEVGCGRLVRDE